MQSTTLRDARAVRAAIGLEAADHVKICAQCHRRGGQLADTCEEGWAIAKRYRAAAADVDNLTPSTDTAQDALF